MREDAPLDWCVPQYRLMRALELSRIPKIYLHANRYNYVVDDENRKVYTERILPVLEDVVGVVDRGTNFIFFHENTGTGKTFNACVILNHFIYKTCVTKRFDFETPLGLFVEYPTLMDDLRYRRDDEDVVLLMEQIRETPLLLLDDVGAGTMSDYTRQQTYMILNYRFSNRKSTIITTNMGLKQLERPEYLDKRNMSRILSNAVGAPVGGRDRRLG